MIYVSGSSGFIGKSLCSLLKKKKIKYKKIEIGQKILNKDWSFVKKKDLNYLSLSLISKILARTI